MCSVLLCVNDAPERLDSRKSNLERLGFTVVSATTVPMALAFLRRAESSTAVLLDCGVERLDPDGTAFRIKQQIPRKPVLLVSAQSQPTEHVHWFADENVIDSEGLGRLLEVVERVTDRPRQLEIAA